jgi:hypothetical protein
MNKLINFIKDLISKRFYGSLLIKFESGKIVYLKKEETIKLSE